MSGLGVLRASPVPPAGRGTATFLPGSVLGPAGSTPFPSPGAGSGRSHLLAPSPYLEASRTSAGQVQGPGEARDTEGADQAPEASAVTNGAANTTADQDPAQAGSCPSPQ